jgi:hypothetical protein
MSEEKSIETLLLKASQEPEYREAFYEKLLATEVFVLGGDDAQEGENINESEMISLLEWESEEGIRAIPFFTSYDLLAKAVGEEHLYLPLQAAVLFATVPDMNLVMNPGFDASKMFTPDEIQMILTTEFGEEDSDEGAEFSEDISLKPITTNRSVKMLKALKELFSKREIVKLAYVAEMAERDANNTLQLAIGIEVEGDEGELFSEVSDIILELAENETVDLFKINRKEKEGMSAYFIHEMNPFYVRKD